MLRTCRSTVRSESTSRVAIARLVIPAETSSAIAGYWLVGFLTQSNTYSSPAGLRKAAWPDGNPVAKPRPPVVHHETETFITTYAAVDPLRSAGRTVTLDGFFGWPLTAHAS